MEEDEEIAQIVRQAFAKADRLEELDILCNFALQNIPPKHPTINYEELFPNLGSLL